jgi:hypothetical protein
VIAEAIASCAIGFAFVVVCRRYWVTRRQPVRDDAPTGDKPWMRPSDFWHD